MSLSVRTRCEVLKRDRFTCAETLALRLSDLTGETDTDVLAWAESEAES